MNHLYLYAPQNVAVRALLDEAGLCWPSHHIQPVASMDHLRGVSSGTFAKVAGHPHQIPTDIACEIERIGMTVITLDDAYLRAKRTHESARKANALRETKMTKDQIKHMVDRFLAWKLPEDFSPDGGISFKRTFNEHTAHPMRHEPSGTNLFDATQADAMVRHMLNGMPEG